MSDLVKRLRKSHDAFSILDGVDNDDLVNVLDAASALEAREGWRLAPVEPTQEMLNAAQERLCEMEASTYFNDYEQAEMYGAMLAAAPSAIEPASPVPFEIYEARMETESEHIARDMREGRFPKRSAPQVYKPPSPVAGEPPVAEPRMETESEHIARDMREGRFPKRSEPQPVAEPSHPDDEAVDRFAEAMKLKLKFEREERGRGGWEAMTEAALSRLLTEHLSKRDPVDIANLAMMLHQNGQSYTAVAEPSHEGNDHTQEGEPVAWRVKDYTDGWTRPHADRRRPFVLRPLRRGKMSKKLAIYNSKGQCPKCGSRRLGTFYEPPINEDPCWYDRTYRPEGKWPETEFLRRNCNGCGYEWPEACRP